MNILVTGAKGFIGKNLLSQLRNIHDGKAKNYAVEGNLTLYEYDLDSTPEELDLYCKNADFVFNLAGVNRPQDPVEFMKGNFGFASTLLDTLKKHGASNYNIFLNEATNQLFAYVEIESEARWNTVADTDICKEWWAYMKDIMPSNADNSPISSELTAVFHLA